MPAETRAHPKDYATFMDALAKMKVQVVKPPPVQHNPTGILSLDVLLRGGLPKGKMILHYGAKNTGKSTIWYFVIRQVMNQGQKVLLIDSENSFTREYAELIGMDTTLLDRIHITNVELAWDVIIGALESKAYGLIVIDTLAQLSPSTEQAASVSKQHMGLQPRINSQATRMWTEQLRDSGTTVVFINQQRSSLDTYGDPNTNPGGQAIEFNAAIILYSMSAKDNVYDDSGPSELVFRFRVKRCKLWRTSPEVVHEMHIACTPEVHEVDFAYELFMAATELGVLTDEEGNPWQKNVAWFEGQKLANGKAQIQEWFRQESSTRDLIEQAVYNKVSDDAGRTATPE